ncbi:MAG: hypothetical protein H0X29_06830 [Parachlamydiaceae bacterium]|nr:hypothetical protein [Parachlamydiaceae bacterium]
MSLTIPPLNSRDPVTAFPARSLTKKESESYKHNELPGVLKELSWQVGQDALLRIDSCIIRWQAQKAKHPKLGFLKNIFTADTSEVSKSKAEVKKANKEIKNLNHLKNEIINLQKNLKNSKGKGLAKIYKLSNEILIKGEIVLKELRAMNLHKKTNFNLKTHLEVSLERIKEITKAVNKNYKKELNNTLLDLSRSYYLINNENSKTDIKSKSALLIKIRSLQTLLLGLRAKDTTSLAISDPIKVCTIVTTELDQITTVYEIEKETTKLQIKLKNSRLPKRIEIYWQDELKKIKPIADKSELRALQELTAKFDRFSEYAKSRKELGPRNNMSFKTETFQFRVILKAINEIQDNCNIILKQSKKILKSENVLWSDNELKRLKTDNEEEEWMTFSIYLSENPSPNRLQNSEDVQAESLKREELVMKLLIVQQQEYFKIINQKEHIVSLNQRAKTRVDFDNVKILSNQLHERSAKLLERITLGYSVVIRFS